MSRTQSKFQTTVDELIEGFQSGEIALESEEEDWGRARIPLARLFDGVEGFARAVADAELRGAVVSNELCVKALALAQSSLDLFRPAADVCASYWTLADDAAELMTAYYPSDADGRLGHIMLGKVPVQGSPCGESIRSGRPIFIGDLKTEGEMILDEQIAQAIRESVRCVVSWPLRIFERSGRSPAVAAVLIESPVPFAVVDNAPTRLLLKACAFLFELAFQIGLRESRMPYEEAPETAADDNGTGTD